MRRKLHYTTMLLAAGAATVAIAAAPTAAAAPTCSNLGGSNTMCQSPGNAEITAEPGATARHAAQLQLPFGGDMGALLFHHGGHR